MPRSRTEVVSLLAPLASYLLLILLVQPWGNYPLNDDWIYARIGKRFAETGRFVFDHDTGAAFMGQGMLAAPFIRFFGFSHTCLRCLTMCMGALILCFLWMLLRYAQIRPALRAAALLVVTWNPLFAYLSFSFMTEIYAYSAAFLGAVIWIRDRRAHPDGQLISWFGAIATAVAVGSGFWVRQYCVVAFPALLAATALTNLPRLKQSLPRFAVSCLAFALVIAGCFYYAHYRAEAPLADYSRRLGRIWPINPVASFLEIGIFLTYMTAFLLPLLVLGGRLWSRKVVPAVVLLAMVGGAAALLLLQTPPHLDLHPTFPFLSNLIRNAGLGPILLPDVQFAQMASPTWPPAAWGTIECLLLAANLLWAPVIYAAPGILRKPGLRAELLVFALLLSLASLTVTTLVDRLAAFDRYYLPETFGLAIALAVVLSDAPQIHPARFAAALLPLAFFTAAGLHDYFRWNDSAWDLYRQALSNGVSPANIEGSYEMNGWYAFSLYQAHQRPPACIGPCHCDSEWFCLDDSYRVGMNLYGNYELLAIRHPSYWLAPGPPIVLSRRKPF